MPNHVRVRLVPVRILVSGFWMDDGLFLDSCRIEFESSVWLASFPLGDNSSDPKRPNYERQRAVVPKNRPYKRIIR